MKEFKCLTCSKIFKSYDLYRNPKYCSSHCFGNRPILESTRLKMAQAKKGKAPWNKGIEMWKDKPHPRGTLGRFGLNKGRKASQETKKKLRDSHLGIKLPERSGAVHHFWKGGITSETERARKSIEYKTWRRKVFERDNFICQMCKKKGGYLHADHILPFSEHLDKRYDLDNGRTLCLKCHRSTDTYGGKMHRKKMEIIKC